MTAPRLEIGDGRWLPLAGIPCLAAGIYLFLGAIGVVPLAREWGGFASWFTAATLVVLGLSLFFGATRTTFDLDARTITRYWSLLPLALWRLPLDDFAGVSLGFTPGTRRDYFTVELKGRLGGDVSLWGFSTYARARERGEQVARHLGCNLEDTTTDHVFDQSPSQLDRKSLRRLSLVRLAGIGSGVPSWSRVTVSRESGGVRVVIPDRRPGAPERVAGALLLLLSLAAWPLLIGLLRHPRMSDPIEWIFPGILTIILGLVPPLPVVMTLLGMQFGGVTVLASRDLLEIRRRDIWPFGTAETLDAADVLDVDYSTRTNVEDPLNAGGLIVKTRRGLIPISRDLEEREMAYVRSVLRQALRM